MATRMRCHLSSALVVGLSPWVSSMQSVTRSRRSAILAVLTRGCSFQLRTVDTFGFKAYLAAHQRVVGVAVSALVTVGTEETVEKGFRVITRSSWCYWRDLRWRQDTLWLGLVEKKVLVTQRSSC